MQSGAPEQEGEADVGDERPQQVEGELQLEGAAEGSQARDVAQAREADAGAQRGEQQDEGLETEVAVKGEHMAEGAREAEPGGSEAEAPNATAGLPVPSTELREATTAAPASLEVEPLLSSETRGKRVGEPLEETSPSKKLATGHRGEEAEPPAREEGPKTFRIPKRAQAAPPPPAALPAASPQGAEEGKERLRREEERGAGRQKRPTPDEDVRQREGSQQRAGREPRGAKGSPRDHAQQAPAPKSEQLAHRAAPPPLAASNEGAVRMLDALRQAGGALAR